MDVLNKAQRTYCMSKIRGKNTRPEKTARAIIRNLGFRYTLNSSLPGKPDMKIIGHRVLIFVDGCFWHACPIHFNKPKTNAKFWREKIDKNRTRDKIVKKILSQSGYQIIRIWEHETKDAEKLEFRLKNIFNKLLP